MEDAGIVVVTHNSEAVVGECLDAALRTGADVVVVDNGSADRTLSEVGKRQVALIRNDINMGFAGAVNQGVRRFNRQWILLLNPDAVLMTQLGPMVEACRLPGVGAVGGKLVGRDGSPQKGFAVRRFPWLAAMLFEVLLINRFWPSNPVNRRFRCLDLDLERSQEVDQPAGALLMVRRDAWREVGGFDESFYPVWFEDVDFCKRLRDAGWSVRYEPGTAARHLGGHSVSRLGGDIRPVTWYSSLLTYAIKHFRPGEVRVLCIAILAGTAFRVLPSVVLERSIRPLKGCVGVMRLAARQFCALPWKS